MIVIINELSLSPNDLIQRFDSESNDLIIMIHELIMAINDLIRIFNDLIM